MDSAYLGNLLLFLMFFGVKFSAILDDGSSSSTSADPTPTPTPTPAPAPTPTPTPTETPDVPYGAPKDADPNDGLRSYDPARYTDHVTASAGDDSFTAPRSTAWFGLDGADSFTGSSERDYVALGAGNDSTELREGNDIADGGLGNDTIDGGLGDDTLLGGEGDDKVSGNADRDYIFGEAGNDTIEGGSGADRLIGGDGNDRIYSRTTVGAGAAPGEKPDGVDTLDGGAGDDWLQLGAGDLGYGGAGSDNFAIDTRQPTSTAAARVADFTAATDTIEIQYAQTATPPVVTVAANATGTAGIITFNGAVIAEVTGGQALTLADLKLTAL